jgi:hypothetical protein
MQLELFGMHNRQSHDTLQRRALLETIEDTTGPLELVDSDDEGDERDEDDEDGEDDEDDEDDEDGEEDKEDADDNDSGNDTAQVLNDEEQHSGVEPLFLFYFSLSYIMLIFESELDVDGFPLALSIVRK